MRDGATAEARPARRGGARAEPRLACVGEKPVAGCSKMLRQVAVAIGEAATALGERSNVFDGDVGMVRLINEVLRPTSALMGGLSVRHSMLKLHVGCVAETTGVVVVEMAESTMMIEASVLRHMTAVVSEHSLCCHVGNGVALPAGAGR